MRIAAFVIFSLAICGFIIYWIYTPRRDRRTAMRHVKKWWWVPIVVFAVVFLFAVVNSQLTVKLF